MKRFKEARVNKMNLNKNTEKVYTIEASDETIDNALSKIGFGKFNYIVITLTGITLACVFLGDSYHQRNFTTCTM